MPWIDIGGLEVPVGYLLHVSGARGDICSGPSRGAESTFVRAERWIPNWEDMATEEAERELLLLYMRAFGPASPRDFAIWTGMTLRDANELWARESASMAAIDAGGAKGYVLASDLPELEGARLEGTVVRLLPYFDSFLLGHGSHRDIVDVRNQPKIYRNAGWVSPALLVNGRAHGVWSYSVKGDGLHVTVTPFAGVPRSLHPEIQKEVEGLGKFLSEPVAETRIS